MKQSALSVLASVSRFVVVGSTKTVCIEFRRFGFGQFEIFSSSSSSAPISISVDNGSGSFCGRRFCGDGRSLRLRGSLVRTVLG
ncbi:hypothetical protein DL96DRAFT_1642045 [Flagelloscypha sp. PMI_526]|nr:hypothetical protein DL96DRAFT_1642045 [Flagelloscypha sp. PMI_526]